MERDEKTLNSSAESSENSEQFKDKEPQCSEEYLLNSVNEIEIEVAQHGVVRELIYDYLSIEGYALPVFISEYGVDRLSDAMGVIGYNVENLIDKIEPDGSKRPALIDKIDRYNQVALAKSQSFGEKENSQSEIMQTHRNNLDRKGGASESNQGELIFDFLSMMRKVEAFNPSINETIKSGDPETIEDLFNNLDKDFSDTNELKERIKSLSAEIDSMISKTEADENVEFDSKYDAVISQIKSIELLTSGLPEGNDSRTVLEGALSNINDSMAEPNKAKNEKIDLLTKDLREARTKLENLAVKLVIK